MIDNTDWAIQTIEKLHFEPGDILVITTENMSMAQQAIACIKPRFTFRVPVLIKRPDESIEKMRLEAEHDEPKVCPDCGSDLSWKKK